MFVIRLSGFSLANLSNLANLAKCLRVRKEPIKVKHPSYAAAVL